MVRARASARFAFGVAGGWSAGGRSWRQVERVPACCTGSCVANPAPCASSHPLQYTAGAWAGTGCQGARGCVHTQAVPPNGRAACARAVHAASNLPPTCPMPCADDITEAAELERQARQRRKPRCWLASAGAWRRLLHAAGAVLPPAARCQRASVLPLHPSNSDPAPPPPPRRTYQPDEEEALLQEASSSSDLGGRDTQRQLAEMRRRARAGERWHRAAAPTECAPAQLLPRAGVALTRTPAPHRKPSLPRSAVQESAPEGEAPLEAPPAAPGVASSRSAAAAAAGPAPEFDSDADDEALLEESSNDWSSERQKELAAIRRCARRVGWQRWRRGADTEQRRGRRSAAGAGTARPGALLCCPALLCRPPCPAPAARPRRSEGRPAAAAGAT